MTVLYDAVGPRTRRRVAIGSVVGTLALVGLVIVALTRLAGQGQLAGELWRPLLTNTDLQRLLWGGLVNTLQAAALAGALSLAVGGLLAVARLSPAGWLARPAGFVVELFRGLPLLLLILFAALALPSVGVTLPVLWYLVIGLTTYNGAVLAEIFRAGILSLPRGQTEAAYAVGLTRGQTLRLVLIPQAVRRMLPALISQLVTLLKDTSLGFVIAYDEMLRRGRNAVEFLGSDYALPIYTGIAVLYILVNLSLSMLARWAERRHGGGGPGSVTETGLTTADA